jgi:hypothetical protein
MAYDDDGEFDDDDLLRASNIWDDDGLPALTWHACM